MGRQGQRIYLCEGETERHLVRALIHKELILTGKQELFNATQREAKRLVRKWGYGIQFVIIVDADTGPYGPESQLIQNLKTLASHHKKVGLIVQCGNLEDELSQSCRITCQQLYSLFGASSDSEFKERFLRVHKTHVIAQLRQGGFQEKRLWQQSCRDTAIPGNQRKWLELDLWGAY